MIVQEWSDPRAYAKAVVRFFRDNELRDRLTRGARADAKRYSKKIWQHYLLTGWNRRSVSVNQSYKTLARIVAANMERWPQAFRSIRDTAVGFHLFVARYRDNNGLSLRASRFVLPSRPTA